MPNIRPAQMQLDKHDMDTICAFNYHITKSTTRDTFDSLQYPFPIQIQDMKLLFQAQARIAKLSGLRPEFSDCCPKICCCYTGAYASLDRCPFPTCQKP